MSIKLWIKKNFTSGQLVLSIAALVIFVSVLPIVLIVQDISQKKAATVKDYQDRYIIKKFKRIEENASAMKLEELSGNIGIDLVPKGS
jgi:MFS-type transporter involved in bile tolerance (Atg22 family)